jgi:hypothetical protein
MARMCRERRPASLTPFGDAHRAVVRNHARVPLEGRPKKDAAMPARSHLQTLGVLFAATLAACGGGSSDAPPPPAPPTTVELSGRIVDGPLQGATACYDLNDNQRCDASEPRSAASDAAGRFTITVGAAEAGRHATIAEVPASAIDADTGAAVGKSFTLVAPAGATSGVFVSPLSTLVVQQMNASGQTAAQASDFVRTQAGLAISPLADFTAATSADHVKAANVAKLVLQATLQQQAAVAAAVGQTDVSGAPIAAADLERAVQTKVIEALPALGAAAADPALAGLTGTTREQALVTAAGQVVAGIGFTPEQARFVIGIPKLPQAPQGAPGATAAMVALQYTDAANWFFRYNAATAADNTPDAGGLTRYYSVRTRMAPYAFEPTQGVAESFARSPNPELHWSGSAWTACTITDRSNQTPRDALGRSSYDFCRGIEKGTSQRGEIDIAGQTLASVWTNRILVEQAKTNNPGAWSLANTALLGSAVFPAGSRLILQTNTITDSAVAYNTADGNRVGVSPLDQAQGGDARTGSPACALTFTSTPATSLEQLVERYPGRPCIFNQQTDANGTSLNPNEVWGISTVSLGTLATNVERPASTGNYYTTTRLLRASFPSPGNTVYWSCLQRTTNNAVRNCTQIGSGTYTIGTLGDARTMTFDNLPAAAQALASTRVFVERGGAVYFGFRNRVGAVSTTVRLNLAAANALLYQLQMPGIQPADAPQPLAGAKATNAAALAGAWVVADANGAAVLRFGADGRYLMAQATPSDASGRPGIEEGYVDFDLAAAQQLGLVLNVDSNNQWGLSHPQPNDRITSITSSAITLGDGTVISRLVEDQNGIVGMWALGSASDFKATHFVFFANGKALSIHPAETEGPCAAARQGPPGVEWSDYSFDAATGVLTLFNKTIDSSGCTGVWDATDATAPASVSFTITMAADKKSFTTPVDGGASTLTAYRIAPRP